MIEIMLSMRKLLNTLLSRIVQTDVKSNFCVNNPSSGGTDESDSSVDSMKVRKNRGD